MRLRGLRGGSVRFASGCWAAKIIIGAGVIGARGFPIGGHSPIGFSIGNPIVVRAGIFPLEHVPVVGSANLTRGIYSIVVIKIRGRGEQKVGVAGGSVVFAWSQRRFCLRRSWPTQRICVVGGCRRRVCGVGCV